MRRPLAFVLLLLLAVPASADNDAKAHLTAFQDAYAKIRTFSARFTQTLTNAEARSTETRRGTIHFRKPFLIRWETTSPDEELIVVTSDAVWDFLPEEEVVHRHPPSTVRDAHALISIVTGQRALDKDFIVEKAQDADGLLAFRLYPREATMQMTEVLILMHPGTHLIDTVEITDFYNNTNRLHFTSMIPDADVPPDAFDFVPPPGVKVESTAR